MGKTTGHLARVAVPGAGGRETRRLVPPRVAVIRAIDCVCYLLFMFDALNHVYSLKNAFLGSTLVDRSVGGLS